MGFAEDVRHEANGITRNKFELVKRQLSEADVADLVDCLRDVTITHLAIAKALHKRGIVVHPQTVANWRRKVDTGEFA